MHDCTGRPVAPMPGAIRGYHNLQKQCEPAMRRVLLGIALAILPTAVPAQQTALTIECDSIRECPSKIDVGAHSIGLRVRIIGLVGSAGENAIVSASASGGQIFPSTTVVTAVDTARLSWSGTVSRDSTIAIAIVAVAGSRSAQRVLHLTGVAPGLALGLARVSGTNATWFVGRYVPDTAVVAITGLNAVPVSGPSVLDSLAALCEAQVVVFKPLANDSAKPDTVRARYELGNGVPSCLARSRWKLGSASGEQQFHVELVAARTHVASSTGPGVVPAVDFTATAREPAHLVVGLAAIVGGVSFLEPNQTDSATKRSAFQPVVGVDAPLVVGAHVRNDLLDHTRLLFASFFGNPGFDLYLGVELPPLLLGPPAEQFPVQLAVGRRFGLGHTNGAWAVALTYDATGILSNALAGLGIAASK